MLLYILIALIIASMTLVSSVENDSAPPSADEDTAGIVDLLSLDLNDESHALPSDSADLPPDSNFR